MRTFALEILFASDAAWFLPAWCAMIAVCRSCRGGEMLLLVEVLYHWRANGNGADGRSQDRERLDPKIRGCHNDFTPTMRQEHD